MTINVHKIYKTFVDKDIKFFSGVPDSLLKDFCGYMNDEIDKSSHIIAANEGNAISLGIGYHLSTNKVPLIYMQNSGLGNAINPLLSLADKDVYSIPMVLMIGWRGEPGVKDEPQHIKQGKITLDLLKTMDIPHIVISGDDTDDDIIKNIKQIIDISKNKICPVAIVVRKNTFLPYKQPNKKSVNYEMLREDAIKSIVDSIGNDEIIVATTGVTSRELFEYREEINSSHRNDFYTVGGMGHASQIALAIAIQNKHKNVFCFDGDGAVIMHMGSMGIIGKQRCVNFRHIVFNNGCHDSVGGQPTVGFDIDFVKIANAMNYTVVKSVKTKKELNQALKEISVIKKDVFLEVKVKGGYRENLGRPNTSPNKNKELLMESIKK